MSSQKIKETDQKAEQLKAQGNDSELYQKGQYWPSYRNYTAAINKDAVYYANRAAVLPWNSKFDMNLPDNEFKY